MIVHYILLVLILGLAYPLCIRKPSKGKKIIYLAIIFAYMWFLATFRKDTGFDYQAYIDIFNHIKTLPASQLFTRAYEPGFVLLTRGMGYLTSSSIVMYGIYSFIILVPIAYFIYKHCEDAWLSAWLYMTMAFFFNNMNFIRQSLACSVGIFCFKFLKEKKPIPYIIIALLAGSFHKTALILIPIYFVAHIKLTLKKGIIYTSAVIILLVFSPQIVDFATNYIFKGYKNTRFVANGLGGVFLVIPIVVLIIGVALYPIWKKRDENAGLYLNILILNTTFWLFGALRHSILERFCMYTYVLTIAILPMALRSLKSSPETIAQRDELEKDLAKMTNPPKQEKAKLAKLNEEISDHTKYYWSAVAAVLIITFIYLYFGMYVNNFHNVIHYRSHLDGFNDFLIRTEKRLMGSV